jgi:hypothetical protein
VAPVTLTATGDDRAIVGAKIGAYATGRARVGTEHL